MTLDNYLTLLGTVATLALAAYLTVGIFIRLDSQEDRLLLQPRDKFWVAVIFGLLTFYAAAAALPINGVNIRLAGPLIAGILAGPVAGIGAGLFGVLYLICEHTMSLPTASADRGNYFWIATLSTVWAGYVGGWLRRVNDRRWPGVVWILIGVLASLLSTVVLLFVFIRPPEQAWSIVRWFFPTFFFFDLLAVALCLLLLRVIWLKAVNEKKLNDLKTQVAMAQRVQRSFTANTMEPCPGFEYWGSHCQGKEISKLMTGVQAATGQQAAVFLAGIGGEIAEAMLYLPLVQAVCRLGIGTGRSLKWLLIKLRQFAGLFSRYRMDISLIYGFLDREAGEARLLCIGGARLFYEDDNGNQRVVVGQPLTDDSGLDDHLLVLPWRPGSQLLMVSVADRAFPPGYDQIVGRQFFRPVPWLVRQQLVREWHGRELGDRREYAIICGECTAGETGKKSG